MIDVNIFLAFTGADNELKKLAAQKITTWNSTHTHLGYHFHPRDWLTNSTPETSAEHRDGQFFINKQVIDKCELMFALIINGVGTPYICEEKRYPCAVLYEVDYHRKNGKRACIFLNNDEPRQEHFQFARDNGMGLFWCGNEPQFKEMIYEKIDQILMEYTTQEFQLDPIWDKNDTIAQNAKKVVLEAYRFGMSFTVVNISCINKAFYLAGKEQKKFFECDINESTEILMRLKEEELIQNLVSVEPNDEYALILRDLGYSGLKEYYYHKYGKPVRIGSSAHRVTKIGRLYCQKFGDANNSKQ